MVRLQHTLLPSPCAKKQWIMQRDLITFLYKKNIKRTERKCSHMKSAGIVPATYSSLDNYRETFNNSCTRRARTHSPEPFTTLRTIHKLVVTWQRMTRNFRKKTKCILLFNINVYILRNTLPQTRFQPLDNTMGLNLFNVASLYFFYSIKRLCQVQNC